MLHGCLSSDRASAQSVILYFTANRRQGRQPTCPMCNARIQLEVLYRLPLPWRPVPDSAEPQVTCLSDEVRRHVWPALHQASAVSYQLIARACRDWCPA